MFHPYMKFQTEQIPTEIKPNNDKRDHSYCIKNISYSLTNCGKNCMTKTLYSYF